MNAMPRAPRFDSTLALLLQGYDFVSNECRELQSSVFRTRVLGQPTICMKGRAAAEIFYDEERFTRKHAAPIRMQATLLGHGSVQGLDGGAHRLRKAMLLSLLTPERTTDLVAGFEREWQRAVQGWSTRSHVILRDEVATVLGRAVCEWAGVPLPEADVKKRIGDLVALFESPAAFGPPHWRGLLARVRSERWLAGLVERERKAPQAPNRAIGRVATHRDLKGELLSARVAAVELLNVLRPTVAVVRFIVFVAMALHQHPSAKLETDEDVQAFVQEVRRYYPFFPTAVARVKRTFEWNGMTFPRGDRVLLDLYGTNRDADSWAHASRFDPERFRDWEGNPFSFIPQGGGEHASGHRCAGEWLTLALMKSALRMLTTAMKYEVPSQDLSVSHSRMPAGPKSGFCISRVTSR